jgi:hypothetical protein
VQRFQGGLGLGENIVVHRGKLKPVVSLAGGCSFPSGLPTQAETSALHFQKTRPAPSPGGLRAMRGAYLPHDSRPSPERSVLECQQISNGAAGYRRVHAARIVAPNLLASKQLKLRGETPIRIAPQVVLSWAAPVPTVARPNSGRHGGSKAGGHRNKNYPARAFLSD